VKLGKERRKKLKRETERRSKGERKRKGEKREKERRSYGEEKEREGEENERKNQCFIFFIQSSMPSLKYK
jgi:hypothetical protein